MQHPDGAAVDLVAALLDEEAEAFRPFERLGNLGDAALDAPVAAAHDWAGRDLIAHLVGWLGDALAVATELRAADVSPARDRSRREFAARGDDINAEIQAEWRRLPLAEVRRRLSEVPATLRRAIQDVPASRWTVDPENLRFVRVYTIEHYLEHTADLEAVLGAARE